MRAGWGLAGSAVLEELPEPDDCATDNGVKTARAAIVSNNISPRIFMLRSSFAARRLSNAQTSYAKLMEVWEK